MANEYLVNSADLTSVADAIRAKGGTSGTLVFPDGFVEAVGAIQAGGGESADDYAMALLENTLSEIPSSWSNKITTIKDYGFYNQSSLQTAMFSTLTSVGKSAFENCSSLQSFDAPNLETVNERCFVNCKKMTSINLPSAKTIWTYGFGNCSGLTSTEGLSAVETINSVAFEGCTGISEFIFPSLTKLTGAGWGGAFRNVQATKFSAPRLWYIVMNSFYGSSISDFDIPNVTEMDQRAFAKTKAVIADFRMLTTVGTGAFRENASMKIANLPLVTQLKNETFHSCPLLEYVMLGSLTAMGSNEFASGACANLVLFSKEAMATCANSNSLDNVSAIYVPRTLLSDYQAATNYVSHADRIFAIEDSADVLAKLAEYGNEYEVSE